MTNDIVLEIENPSETQLEIDSVRLSKIEDRKVVVFYSPTYGLYLPIWVGSIEGDVIVSELNNIPHQTTTKLLEQLNPTGNLLRISITDLSNEVYKATITISEAGNETHMPMRPSDALAIAIRQNLPMYARTSVIEQAGTKPDTGILSKITNALNIFKSKFRIRLSRSKK